VGEEDSDVEAEEEQRGRPARHTAIHEKPFDLKVFWQRSLLYIFKNITSKEHAV
jgi:hypothetical protein